MQVLHIRADHHLGQREQRLVRMHGNDGFFSAAE